jgi:hypothetical protein
LALARAAAVRDALDMTGGSFRLCCGRFRNF